MRECESGNAGRSGGPVGGVSSGRSVSAYALGAGVCVIALALSASVRAETMSGALARAYVNSPDINAQRANVRGVDENIPKQKAGWLPKVNATGNLGAAYMYTRGAPTPATPLTRNPLVASNIQTIGSATLVYGTQYHANPRNYGITATETLFDGFRTLNSVRQAESQTFAAREQMRTTESSVLLNGATSYMNVLRDTAILSLRKNNISVLEEQLRQTRDRFQVGEVTRTDVAQAEASLAQARTDFFSAQSTLQASIASYRQYIGVEPKNLSPAKSVEPLLPKKMGDAVEVSQVEHPLIAQALHNVDVATAQVKIAEAQLYPTLSVNGNIQRGLDVNNVTGAKNFVASVTGQLNVPIYQGGAEYASIRQAKEQLGQSRLQVDVQRDTIRAQVVTAWGQLETAKAQLISGQANVAAAEIALNGIREEAKVGQRTTYDVLTAQQTLLNARVNLVTAQRDRVVASYNVLAAMGRLNADQLSLTAQLYDPTLHFDQVRNKFFGISTPDGR